MKAYKHLRLVGKFARWFVTDVKHWITFSLTSHLTRVVKKALISLKHRINAHPKLKVKVLNVLNSFPALKTRLKRVGQVNRLTQYTIAHVKGPIGLSPQVKKIYTDLKKAIDLEKGNN